MALLEAGTPGRRRHISQTRYEERPYTNCTGMAMTSIAEFGGLHITDVTAWIKRGRRMTGIPERDEDGNTLGTRVADWVTAWRVMAPWVEIHTGWIRQGELLRRLKAGELAAAVGISCPALSTHLRRFVGLGFDGDHRGVLNGARDNNGDRAGGWQVRWDDPMGDGDYDGEWADWSDIRAGMAAKGQVSGDFVWVAYIERGGAVRTNVLQDRPLTPGSTVMVPKGSDTFTLDEASGVLKMGKPTSSRMTAPADAIVRVRQYPAGGSPSGTMVHVTGGALDGGYVRQSAVTLTEPQQGTCADQVDAATRPLLAELKERDDALAVIAAAAAGVTP